MRRSIAYPLVALGAVGSTLFVAAPALAHGYVSSPPSRQALCASGAVANCGQIQFEPQSVEGPKGLKSCDGGVAGFSVLADESRNWPAKAVGKTVSFTWVMTARHRTSNWEYFIGGKKVATVDGGNAQPDAVVTHDIDLGAFPGRQKVLAVWNIGDTANAFYSCIDLNVGGGAGSGTTPPTTAPAPTTPAVTTAPTAAPTTGAPAPAKDGKAWAPGVTYRTGDEVTYEGVRYRCRQGHSSIRSWEPSIFTLALWLPL
ncbi:lytic polysaccharide monooxygenase [Amorphoplanes digitatis]|uniref:Chitin-binding protein n=1 Tax=Actinoplanes digitatis TaxID=1868 RepID=A0A7W7MMD3_9ACTN|nr:lytic polysaccharide monooxygenase [Actinoplanes digitatis]MBB4759562.1 chitin-binding protein [Actinoplanes digitatis]GID94959.1 cellulose-binding protein [Actinoplanes digitatis]